LLAVGRYVAPRGQNEETLQEKIVDLLGAGTKYLWVVRLVGTKRVEVYEPGKTMRVVNGGEQLEAPGVLQNAVPVEALYEEEASRQVMLRNLLQRGGYKDLQHVRDESQQLGREEGQRLLHNAVLDLCEVYGVELSAEKQAYLATLNLAGLDAFRAALKTHKAWPPTADV